MYFDHYGEGIVNTFDQFGSFGLSTSVANPAGIYTYGECAPLYRCPQRSLQWIPHNQRPITYPYTAPSDTAAALRLPGAPITI